MRKIIISMLCVLFSVFCFVAYKYKEAEEQKRNSIAHSLSLLQIQANSFLELRSWEEAEWKFAEMKQITANPDWLITGRKKIAHGKLQEREQFVAYWKGEAETAFASNRWQDAELAADEVLSKYSDETDLIDLKKNITAAKLHQELQERIKESKDFIRNGDFHKALSRLDRIPPNTSERAELIEQANTAILKQSADLSEAKSLLHEAKMRHTGSYNQEALALMKKAVILAPNEPEILSYYQQISSYGRKLHVPNDYISIQAALEVAKDRDQILIAEGTWMGPILIKNAVEIIGVKGKSFIECPASEGSVVAFLPGIKGARIMGLSLRHQSFDPGDERFSVVQIHQSDVQITSCRVELGSGHGIMISEGAKVSVVDCQIHENGWNGIAIMGANCELLAEKNKIVGNFQNGIELWAGGDAILKNNECYGNSRNGIHIDSETSFVEISENRLEANREFGIVLSAVGRGSVSENVILNNFLGGAVIHSKSKTSSFTENSIEGNLGAGLALEKGLKMNQYSNNSISENKGAPILGGINLSDHH